MRLKLFRAATVPDAMARVRAELGAEALILGIRRVGEGVEVTAALEPLDALPPPLPPDPKPSRLDFLAYHGVPERLRPNLSRGPLAPALGRALAFGGLGLDPSGSPLLLTGPPGAGKTLTLVRLATRLVMAGVMPMIVTADSTKAGATEQLRAFTRLLGLAAIEADDPPRLSRTLARRRDAAPVLIDAPGLNPFDPSQSDALRALIAAAGARVALVLPAGLDPSEAADLAQAHAALGAELLIATRLDLARRLGGILAAADAARLPLTEAGIGPGAADGLVPLTPDFLASRLLQTRDRRHDRDAA